VTESLLINLTGPAIAHGWTLTGPIIWVPIQYCAELGNVFHRLGGSYNGKLHLVHINIGHGIVAHKYLHCGVPVDKLS
jgi:hypothetical protein